MVSQEDMSSIRSKDPDSTTTATTTPWPFPALPGALRLHALPKFGLGAPNGNQRRSTVKDGTCLKIMVSPVRVRVPPLLFSRYLQVKHNSLKVPQFFYVAL